MDTWGSLMKEEGTLSLFPSEQDVAVGGQRTIDCSD